MKDGQFIDQEGHILDPEITRSETWGLGNGDHLLLRGPNYRGLRFSFHVEESGSGGHLEFSTSGGDGHTTWMHGELTSIGNNPGLYLPATMMLGQTLFLDTHGGIWTQLLLTLEALDLTEWRVLLEGTDRELVPREPES